MISEGFDFFDLIFKIGAVVLIFVMIYITIDWLKERKIILEMKEQWKKDVELPLSFVDATIVKKRERTSIRTGTNGKSTTFISYCAMFEFENGDCRELSISLPEYNMIAKGDAVQLSFKGKKYIGFEKRRY